MKVIQTEHPDVCGNLTDAQQPKKRGPHKPALPVDWDISAEGRACKEYWTLTTALRAARTERQRFANLMKQHSMFIDYATNIARIDAEIEELENRIQQIELRPSEADGKQEDAHEYE